MNKTVNTNDQPTFSPPVEYDPQAVEMKWQDRWRERGTNATDIPGARDPYYALMMFPYPSAEGLHVGNLFAFVGNDIYGRFQRLGDTTSSSRSATTPSASTRRITPSRSDSIPQV